MIGLGIAGARLRGVALVLGMALAACSGGGGGADAAPAATGTPSPSTPPVASPSAASVGVRLEVPSSLAGAPFDTPRTLTVPPGFGVRLWARVNQARFMALAPNGDVLVSVPAEGRIVLLRERAGDTPQQFEFAAGLRKPHDMVFHTIGNTTYLYIAESNRVTRSIYTAGDTRLASSDIVADNLPDSSTSGLGGAYGHELKNIALGADHKLYVAIASTCNACVADADADPVRGAIYQYDADGRNRRLFARGLRNAEGLDFIPGSNTLWVAVNQRDEIRFPLDEDFDGDGSGDQGKLIPAYVDDNPPETLTAVRNGGNYGWPFCNPAPNAAMSNLPLLPDVEHNPDQTRLDCASADRASKGMRAHSAPLGFSFLHNSGVPAPYRSGALVAMHGCWNCTSLRAGYKVAYFPFDSAGAPGAQIDLVTGFVTDPDARIVWGRPVDAVADARGNILISDDFAGAVYQLYPR